jgi:hypothetical protein
MGLCQDNVPEIANYVNTAQQRLLYCKEAGDESWWGTWAEIVFNVSRAQPYITLPREVARLEAINVCDKPVPVQNQFYEYLQFGNGRMPKSKRWCSDSGSTQQAFTRNNAVTFTEMTNAPQMISAYVTDATDGDGSKRAFIQGLDADSVQVYTLDVANNVMGQFIPLTSPFVLTPQTFSSLTGIQKDVTTGVVRFYQHDPNTGDEVLLLTMQPGETTASYRRYYLHQLPCNCCEALGNPSQVQVTALVKLEIIPVQVPTDYLLIQNKEAIIEECQSIRYSEMDSASAKQMASERHTQAVRMLNGELTHYVGGQQAAVNFSPFGSARLSKKKIGSML